MESHSQPHLEPGVIPQILRTVTCKPSGRPFKSVVVMQPAQNRHRRDPMANRRTMAMKLRRITRWLWPEMEFY
jgi:glutaminase